MASGYRHIQGHEKEIQELKAQVVTHRETAERLGLTRELGKEFFHRKHKMERKSIDGLPVRKKGRPVTRIQNSHRKAI